MVVIRLSRVGPKKRPFFHIVATDKRNSRDGRFIEKIGYFNPIAKGNDEKLKLEIERFEYFLKHGAQCSDRAKFLLKKHLKDNKLTLNEKITPEKKKKAPKLFFTGGTTPYDQDSINEGILYKEHAISLGIPLDAIFVTNKVINTAQEAL